MNNKSRKSRLWSGVAFVAVCCATMLLNAPLRAATQASMTVHVWHDMDEDDQQDAGEPDCAGLGIVLTSATPGGYSADVNFTDANGDVAYVDLPDGEYTISYEAVDGTLVSLGYTMPVDATVRIGLSPVQVWLPVVANGGEL
jgi:hypothetical protein